MAFMQLGSSTLPFSRLLGECPTGSSKRRNNININDSGRIPGGRTPSEEPLPRTQKEEYARPLLFCKSQGIPNINFSEHKHLAAPQLAFQKKIDALKFLFFFFFGPQMPKPLVISFHSCGLSWWAASAPRSLCCGEVPSYLYISICLHTAHALSSLSSA